MKFAGILEISTVKVVLFLGEKTEARYAELDRLVSSRGTLSLTLKELQGEGLIERRVVVSRPIQTYYALSKKGKKVAHALKQLADVFEIGPEI
jgi:DNA-binding HxlR family transcriptional regulator